TGNFITGTTYAITAKAPKVDDTEILARLADLDASGYPWGVALVASEIDILSSVARASMLDGAMKAEHALDRMRRARVGPDVAESDANVRVHFSSTFRSPWVSVCARGAYILTSSNIAGSGYVLRSSSWCAALADAFLPLYKDIGDHGVSYGEG